MTSTRICFALFAGMTIAMAAIAQNPQDQAATTGNPAAISPATPASDVGMPSAKVPNTVDHIVTRQAAIGNTAEVALGKLAGQRAQNQAVKDFAKRMVDDHAKTNDKVVRLAKANGVAIPKEPDPDKKALQAQLEKLHGGAFDVAYINAQVGAHQETAHLLEHEIGSGQDERVKALAQETLPVVMRHLEMARDLQAQLTQK
jgi:putative membrane protein